MVKPACKQYLQKYAHWSKYGVLKSWQNNGHRILGMVHVFDTVMAQHDTI